LRDLVGIRGTAEPLFDLELDGAAPSGVVGAPDDDGNAAAVRALDDRAQRGWITRFDEHGATAGASARRFGELGGRNADDRPTIELTNGLLDRRLV
jgi:hypothetical protein